MNRVALLAGCVTLLAIACNSGTTDATPGGAASEGTSPTPVVAASAIPTLPLATMQLLVDSADHIDYVFYELEFSMSMDEGQGIAYAIAKIGEGPAKRSPQCKPIGRIFYEIKGRTAASAQLYFSQGCTYLEFLDANDQLVYANEMSPVGIEFLNQQFSQIMKGYVPVQ